MSDVPDNKCPECKKNKELLRQEWDLTKRICEARDIFADREKAAKKHIECLEYVVYILEFIVVFQIIVFNLVLWSK